MCVNALFWATCGLLTLADLLRPLLGLKPPNYTSLVKSAQIHNKPSKIEKCIIFLLKNYFEGVKWVLKLPKKLLSIGFSTLYWAEVIQPVNKSKLYITSTLEITEIGHYASVVLRPQPWLLNHHNQYSTKEKVLRFDENLWFWMHFSIKTCLNVANIAYAWDHLLNISSDT